MFPNPSLQHSHHPISWFGIRHGCEKEVRGPAVVLSGSHDLLGTEGFVDGVVSNLFEHPLHPERETQRDSSNGSIPHDNVAFIPMIWVITQHSSPKKHATGHHQGHQDHRNHHLGKVELPRFLREEMVHNRPQQKLESLMRQYKPRVVFEQLFS